MPLRSTLQHKNAQHLNTSTPQHPHLIEEQPADQGIESSAGGESDLGLDMPLDVLDRVLSVSKAADSLGIEEGIVGSVEELHLLGSALVAPLQTVEGDLMGLSIGEVEI